MSDDVATIRFDTASWRLLPSVDRLPDATLYDLLEFERRGTAVWARRRAPWVIGRAETARLILEVPSPIPAGLLLPLVLYADGVDLAVMHSFPHGADADHGVTFQLELAKALLREVAASIGTDTSRSYVEHHERTCLLRGRPTWASTFGKHHSAGVLCRTHELSSDHLINQLILAAIEQSALMVRELPDWRFAAAHLLTHWRSIAQPCRPTRELFEIGFKRLNRLTERYRISLQLARSLMLRIQHDPFHAGGNPAPSVVLNLAVLLEGVVARIITDAVRDVPGADTVLQDVDEASFIDDFGDVYRSVRPDLLLRCGGVPVAVFDAKFKPRYVEGPPSGRLPPENRLTTADLYQIAFYQVRAQQRYRLDRPPVAAIVAPHIESRPLSPRSRRTIRWLAEADGLGARVLPLPLGDLVQALRGTMDTSRLIDVAPELRETVFDALAATPRLVGSAARAG